MQSSWPFKDRWFLATCYSLLATPFKQTKQTKKTKKTSMFCIKEVSCILYRESCIRYHVSWIMNQVTSDIRYQESCIRQHPVSWIMYHVSGNIRYQEKSCILYRESGIVYPASRKYPVSGNYLVLCIVYRVSCIMYQGSILYHASRKYPVSRNRPLWKIGN